MYHSSSAGKEYEVCLEAGMFLNEDVTVKKKKRAKFKPLSSDVLPECRVMALTSFPLSVVYSAGLQLQKLHYVATGCSDALIRYVELEQ